MAEAASATKQAPARAAPGAEEVTYTGPSKVKVLTSDGQVVELDMAYMSLCVTLRGLFETLDEGAEAVPVMVSKPVLAEIEKFCKYHKENPAETSRPSSKTPINHFKAFDRAFATEISKTPALLFQAIVAADYLEQTNLLDILCRQAALLIKGKDPKVVRENFNIPQLTPEQHKSLVEKHPFLKKY